MLAKRLDPLPSGPEKPLQGRIRRAPASPLPRTRISRWIASENVRRYDWTASSGSVVGNDPINGIDPTGESGERITEALVGGLHDLQLQSRIESASSPGVRESRALDARADAEANGRASSYDYDRQAQAANTQVNNEMSRLYRDGNVPSARQLEKFAERQGWQKREDSNGVTTYTSRSGNRDRARVDRLIIKPNPAQRSQGSNSQGPRISFRNRFGGHVDPTTGANLRRQESMGRQGHRPYRPRRPR